MSVRAHLQQSVPATTVRAAKKKTSPSNFLHRDELKPAWWAAVGTPLIRGFTLANMHCPHGNGNWPDDSVSFLTQPDDNTHVVGDCVTAYMPHVCVQVDALCLGCISPSLQLRAQESSPKLHMFYARQQTSPKLKATSLQPLVLNIAKNYRQCGENIG